MNNYFEVINFVFNILTLLCIPCEVRDCFDGYQLRFPWCEGDIICHSGSYGHTEGMVESYMFPWDEGDVTYLRPEDMARRIIAYYEEECGS